MSYQQIGIPCCLTACYAAVQAGIGNTTERYGSCLIAALSLIADELSAHLNQIAMRDTHGLRGHVVALSGHDSLLGLLSCMN